MSGGGKNRVKVYKVKQYRKWGRGGRGIIQDLPGEEQKNRENQSQRGGGPWDGGKI